jgi:predicted O-linked N-acetylglucosamine transferase (SPINDLY family)
MSDAEVRGVLCGEYRTQESIVTAKNGRLSRKGKKPMTTDSLADHMTLSICQEGIQEVLVQAHTLALAGERERALGLLTVEALQTLDHLDPQSETANSSFLVLGSTWRRLGRFNEAAAVYERVRQARPSAAVYHELIALYRLLGRFSLALERSSEAMTQWPQYPEIQALHAECLLSLGIWDEAFRLFAEMVRGGHATAATQLLAAWYRSYLPETTRQDLLDAHRAWAERFAPAHLARSGQPLKPDTCARLRIGYLSPDFRTHSVVYTFEPLLDGRDRERFELVGYGCVAHPDETTDRLKAKFDHYRDVHGRSASEIADCIQADGIDILVTLAGHCSSLCLQTLAHKPAPIQVDIGSVCSLGLPQVDYRITDALQDPPESQAFYTEKLMYVPGGYFPYQAPRGAPDVGPLPALTAGAFTFGSFNNHLKINDDVVAVWSQVLKSVPRSRLLIKAGGGCDAGVAETLLQRFARHGIERRFIRIEGWLPKQEHWNLYNQVDLALDTFPYNGALTILEGLWMGVPTVSLIGDTYVSRTGLTVLSHVGLSSLVASSPEKMVAKAVALAHNREALAGLRAHLRRAVSDSPLCDALRLARGVEAAYQRMWREKQHDNQEPTVLSPTPSGDRLASNRY